MFNKKPTHLFNYFCCLNLIGESKNVYFAKNPEAPKPAGNTLSEKEKKETRERIKDQQKIIGKQAEKAEIFKEFLDKNVTKQYTFDYRKPSNLETFANDITLKFANTFEKRIPQNQLFLLANAILINIKSAFKDLGIFEKLKKHDKLKITINPGGVIEFKDEKGKMIQSLDLRTDSFYARKVDELKLKVAALKDKLTEKKKQVNEKTKNTKDKFADTLDFSNKLINLHNAIKNNPKLKGKVQLISKGNAIKVKFLGKNRAERYQNEKNIKIEDLFNLDLLSMYKDSVLHVQVYNPKTGKKENATYSKTRNEFIIDGTYNKRIKIWEGSVITVKEFKVKRIVREEDKPKNLQKIKNSPEARETEAQKQEDFEKEMRKDRLFAKYGDFIFKKARFGGHKLLQSKEDFKNWDRLSNVLSPILAGPPFNIKSTEMQKKYMELVIQGAGFWDPNWEIQGKDFFKYFVTLYQRTVTDKKGKKRVETGYEPFMKDYNRLRKKYDEYEKQGKELSEDEMELLNELEEIAVGIARVYEALGTMQPLKKSEESQKDKLERTTFLNIGKATPDELKEVKDNKYLNYNLLSLVHSKEKTSHRVDILVPFSVNAQLSNQVRSVISDLPPDKIKQSDIDQFTNNPTRLLFMSFGLNTLVKMGAIKKIDDRRYILTQLPKDNAWAMNVFMQLAKAKTQTPSLEEWERVRATMDPNQKALNFIKKLFGKNVDVENTFGGSIHRQRWSRFWHWEWAKKKYISMSTLSTKTYGANQFEGEAVLKRGYLTVRDNLSVRHKNTGLYEIPEKNHGKLIQTANDYLAKGIEMTIARAPKGKMQEVLDKMVKEFGLTGIKFFKPVEDTVNTWNNAYLIMKQMSVKNINPESLTQAQIKFIRLGFLEARYLETTSKAELKEQYYSDNPKIRLLQEKLRKDGMALTQLPKVEADFKAGMAALMRSKTEVGASGFVGFTLKYTTPEGHSVYASAGIGGLKEGIAASVAIGAALKLGSAKIYFDAGAAAGWVNGSVMAGAGGSVRIETSVSPKSAYSVGLGVAAGGGTGGFGISLLLYFQYDHEKATKLAIEKEMEQYKKITDISGFNKEKIKAIRNCPLSNVRALVYAVDRLFIPRGLNKAPDKVLYFFWDRFKDDVANSIALQTKPAWIAGGGVAFGVTPVGVGAGVYLTMKVAGTDEVIAIRHSVGKFNRFEQEEDAQKELEKKLKSKVTIIKDFTMSGKNAVLFFDSNMAGPGLAKVGMVDESKMEEISADSSFEQIKKIFTRLHIDAKLVRRDSKDKSKGYFIQITPLKIGGGNVEFQIDPDLKMKGLILDNSTSPQRILLTASAIKSFMITRLKVKFPFQSQGALDLHIITFKNRESRSTTAIRNQSVQYLYKKQGEQYQILNGENTRDIPRDERNVLTIENFKNSSRKFETFDNISLINFKEYRAQTKGMSNALQIKSAKEFSLQPGNIKHLNPFSNDWYGKNKKYFKQTLIKMRANNEDSLKAGIFNRLQKDFKEYTKNDPNAKPLSQYELNLLYSMLMDAAFLYIPKNKTEKSKQTIEKMLKIRTEIFRKYLIKYLTKWTKQFPEDWAKIKQASPGITINEIANIISRSMPKNLADMQNKLQNPRIINEDMKFMSYTQKYKGEAMPSVYGAAQPSSIQKNFFKMFGITDFKLDSLDEKDRAVAKVILNLISPLDTGKLETAKSKVDFLNSELSLMLISLYDDKKGISPMIEVLGKQDYKSMIDIYKLARNKKTAKLSELLKDPGHLKAFNEFRSLVLKVRASQMAGKNETEFNRFTIHHDTEIIAGPYLKCSNGTIAARQRFRITTKRQLRIPWTGAYAERNVHVGVTRRTEGAYLTVAAGIFYRPAVVKRPPGERIPPPGGGKETPGGRINSPSSTTPAPAAGSRTVEPTAP